MIAYKGRESKRGRKTPMARNIERLYKEGKCRECSVIVTRMDFAKILGKFTKVKIQYENVSSPKSKKVINQVETSPPANAKVKTNENGLVLVRRNAYNKHPVNNSQTVNRKKMTPSEASMTQQVSSNNVLKENNGLKKVQKLELTKDRNSNYNSKPVIQSNTKQYRIIFVDPKISNNRDCIKKISLTDLVNKIDQSILPTKDWLIEYFPKYEQVKNDKVYDRIEAELEGLMFCEKSEEKSVLPKVEENKVDDFPSIMDILNDNYSVNEPKQNDSNVIIEFKSNLESSDVEAMLLGKPSDIVKISESSPMEVDSTVMSKLIEDVENISTVASVTENIDKSEQIVELSIKENPQSPSILDENLQKGVEEHIPAVPLQSETVVQDNNCAAQQKEGNKNSDLKKETEMSVDSESTVSDMSCDKKPINVKADTVTHIIFKKVTEGKCTKTVTCPMNLNYKIEIHGKSVEFLGAPKYISSMEDLQVLLQIVNDSELDSLYVLH